MYAEIFDGLELLGPLDAFGDDHRTVIVAKLHHGLQLRASV
jgi:hypothetical protein